MLQVTGVSEILGEVRKLLYGR